MMRHAGPLARHGSVLAAGVFGAAALTACGPDESASAPTTASGGSAKHATAHHFDGKTSCSKVLYVGESTSVGLVSPKQIPAANERLQARMKDVGVEKLTVNVSGGRSTTERLLDRPNALDVITPQVAKSFNGCYVIALGVNDAANVAMGARRTLRSRIDMVMKRIGNRPVLWPTVRTVEKTSAYRNSSMEKFDRELRAATNRYPNLRLYDWAAEMNPAWFEGDHIHDRRAGSRARALMYARALAVAFPQGMPANSAKVVGSVWGKPASSKNAPHLRASKGDQHPFWAGDAAAVKLYTSGPKLG